MNSQDISGFDECTQWRTMDAAEIECEYSPSSVIGGDYRPFIENYQILSEKARSACSNIETVRYGERAGNTVDIALPTCCQSAPLLVFIHGGYWQELSKRESFFGADTFSNQGIAYAVVDYTLAPAASVSEIVEECRLAISTIVERAASLGIDQNKIVIAGSSAGAHLAAMCCVDENSINTTTPIPIHGAILLSGVFELEPLVGTSVNQALSMSVEDARNISPQLLAAESFPSVVIAWGELETDEFKRQSRAFARKLKELSRSVITCECPSRNHFDIVHDMENPATSLGQCVLDLVQSRC